MLDKQFGTSTMLAGDHPYREGLNRSIANEVAFGLWQLVCCRFGVDWSPARLWGIIDRGDS
jgi:hypothetical protein